MLVPKVNSRAIETKRKNNNGKDEERRKIEDEKMLS